jgi:hypothetical protein
VPKQMPTSSDTARAGSTKVRPGLLRAHLSVKGNNSASGEAAQIANVVANPLPFRRTVSQDEIIEAARRGSLSSLTPLAKLAAGKDLQGSSFRVPG